MNFLANNDLNNSAGRMTAQKHFPIFLPLLNLNNYLIGETVTSDSATGTVDEWNPRLGILQFLLKRLLLLVKKLLEILQKVESIPSSVESFETYINLTLFKGYHWITN